MILQTLIAKEFLANLLTFRFSIGFLVCLLLIVANTYVLTQDYGDRLDGHQTAVQEHTQELAQVKRYSELCGDHKPRAHRKPKLLSIFNAGMDKRLGNVVEASIGTVPMRAQEHGHANPYMMIFSSIDLALVFQVVLSLLALLFAYDAVAGEREDGTLRLTLSNAVSRSAVLLGKYLGAMACLLIPLAVSLVAGLLVMVISPSISLEGGDWARLGWILLVSLLYLSCFYLLGLLLSSRAQRATTALMFAVFLWVFLVLVYPNATVFLVEKFAPIHSEGETTSAMSELWDEFRHEWDDYLKQQGVDSPFRKAEPSSSNSSSGGDGYSWGETISAQGFKNEEGLGLAQEAFDFKGHLMVRYADQVWGVYQQYLNENPLRQTKLAKKLTRVSPAAAYYHATAALSETDLDSFQRFLAQARQYRREIIQYLNDKKAFSSRQWFADDKGAVDISDLPRFQAQREPLGSSLGRAGTDIFFLVILNVVLFLLTYASFLRYDVR